MKKTTINTLKCRKWYDYDELISPHGCEIRQWRDTERGNLCCRDCKEYVKGGHRYKSAYVIENDIRMSLYPQDDLRGRKKICEGGKI